MAMTTATKTNGKLLDWLRDAHAMEQHAEQMLTSTASRIENYPELKARIERHVEETRRQADKVRSCIERLGGSTSAIKDTAGKAMGFSQALTGMLVGDEVMKASLASSAFEQMEIASYKVLVAAAEEFGDAETAQVCQSILREEEAMRDWLDEQLPALTHNFLARESVGVTAKH